MTVDASTTGTSGFLERSRLLVEHALLRILPPESTPPTILHRAMRYSVLAGGKRLRPALALAAGELGDLPDERLAGAAAALELIHTYSLIHDDLPAMDDDSLRRGKPTCHVVFGEAHAILAGDALLTLAFETLACEPAGTELASRRLEAIRLVAAAAGPAGMVGGQSADLEGSAHAPSAISRELVEFIHRRKTGALIAASVALGAVLGGLERSEVDILERFGAHIGLAFQIADDLLDVEGLDDQIGKTAGKDARAAKLTYPAVLGVEGARRQAQELVRQAIPLLDRFGEQANQLRALAHLLVDRRN